MYSTAVAGVMFVCTGRSAEHRGVPDAEVEDYRARLLGELVLENPPVQLEPAKMSAANDREGESLINMEHTGMNPNS